MRTDALVHTNLPVSIIPQDLFNSYRFLNLYLFVLYPSQITRHRNLSTNRKMKHKSTRMNKNRIFIVDWASFTGGSTMVRVDFFYNFSKV
jgi:hypothetical protein